MCHICWTGPAQPALASVPECRGLHSPRVRRKFSEVIIPLFRGVGESESERERERERGRDREREIERERARERTRQTEKEKDKSRGREGARERELVEVLNAADHKRL